MALETVDPWYRHLDNDFNNTTLSSTGFTNLVSVAPYAMDDATWDGYCERFHRIQRFQQTTLDIFMASLRGDEDPAIADTVLAGQPPCRGKEYHLGLSKAHLQLPVFFRTDESGPGAIVEVQCPGSTWEMAEQIRALYLSFPSDFGEPHRMSQSWSKHFADGLRSYRAEEPIIHHLLNNASRPHGGRYFIQRSRQEGLRYYSWDEVTWKDVNFVRGHEFFDLRYNGFFDDWMKKCTDGGLAFDHPPTPMFDAKVVMAWPFWDKTRDYYPDDLRALFPHTDIITNEGFRLADGAYVTPEQYCHLGTGKRNYYFKFAGPHPWINWGSRGVYHTGGLSTIACGRMFDRIFHEGEQGMFWIAQEATRYPETAVARDRHGELLTVDAYTKLSAFYGPRGLIGILVMQKRSRKVHGTPETIVSIVA